MATYGEYKIISDRSAADLQNTIAKTTTKSVNDYKAIQERDQKERRMFDIRQRKREKEDAADVVAFEKNGKAIAGGINESFNKEYRYLLDQYNDYTNILEDPNSNKKSRKEAMDTLADLDRKILSAKSTQEIYIGGSANLEEKLSNSAALGSNYGFVNLNMGKDKNDEFIMNKDGGVAQDIANQLTGKPGKGDTFTRNTDGSIEATGMYLNKDGKEVNYTTKLTPQQVEAFLNEPTYDYIKPTETAVTNLSGEFLTESGALAEGYRMSGKPQAISATTITGPGRTMEKRKIETPVTGIADKIEAAVLTQYNAFMANDNVQAQKQALESIGMNASDLDALMSTDKDANTKFKDNFIENLTRKIDAGVINTNNNGGKGLFKRDDKWYYVERVSNTDITVSNEFNSGK